MFGLAAGAFGLLALFLVATAWFARHEGAAVWALVFVGAVVASVAFAFGSIWRQRRGTVVRIVGSSLELALPSGRDVARPAALHETVPLADIAAVLTRAEFFGQRMPVAQQAFALQLQGGRVLRLGADRPMREAIYGRAAQAIVQRIGGSGLVDVGAVEIATRAFGLRIGTVPPWGEAALPPTRQAERMRAGRRTWQWVSAALALAALAQLLSNWL